MDPLPTPILPEVEYDIVSIGAIAAFTLSPATLPLGRYRARKVKMPGDTKPKKQMTSAYRAAESKEQAGRRVALKKWLANAALAQQRSTSWSMFPTFRHAPMPWPCKLPAWLTSRR
jgi:hypothetical protein